MVKIIKNKMLRAMRIVKLILRKLKKKKIQKIIKNRLKVMIVKQKQIKKAKV
jgi:hypothetical protein